jgi:hypothetical protein
MFYLPDTELIWAFVNEEQSQATDDDIWALQHKDLAYRHS